MNLKNFEAKLKVKLLPLQTEGYNEEKPILILEGLEGSGKSFLTDCIVLDKTIANERATLLYVAPTKKQAERRQATIEGMILKAGLQDIIKNSVVGNTELINGSVLRFFGGCSLKALKGHHTKIEDGKGKYIIVVLDDATLMDKSIIDALLPTLLLGSKGNWKLILSCNPTDISHWTNTYVEKGQSDNPNVKTFIFKLEDNSFYNKETAETIAELEPDIRDRYNARRKDGSSLYVLPEVLDRCIDHQTSLNLGIKNPDGTYMMAWDLNNPMAESTSRDRDKTVYSVVEKIVRGSNISYRLVASESYLTSTTGELVFACQRMNNLYNLQAILLESYSARGLYDKLTLEENLGCEIRPCNPHKHSKEGDDTAFSLTNAYRYLQELLQQGWIKIPHDAKPLIQELERFRTDGKRFSHPRHGHNDHIASLAWCVLGLRDIQQTGNISVDRDIRISAKGGGFSSGYDIGRRRRREDTLICAIDSTDREFLEVDGSPDFNWSDVDKIRWGQM